MNETLSLERKNYEGIAQPVGPYVHAVKYNGLLYVSGLTAFGSPHQKLGIAEQAATIFDQLEIIAKQEGTTLASLIKVTLFVTSMEEIAKLRATLTRYYGSHLPASSLVQVQKLFSPDLLIEIEAVLASAD